MKLLKSHIELFGNILAGTRAAFFMPVQLWSFKGGYLQVCLLLVVSFSFSFFGSYFETKPNNIFNVYGLSYQATLYLLFLFSLSLIAYLSSRFQDLSKLIVMFLSIVPIVYLVSSCLVKLSNYQNILSESHTIWAIFYIYLFWNLAIALRIIKCFLYCRILPALAYLLIFAVINVPPMYSDILPHVPLWYSLQTAKNVKAPSYNINVEKVYYSQNTLLDDTLKDLVEGRVGITDLFFIGFAGDADEDVFMNEAKSAQVIINDHFNAFGRSLLLINNEETVETIPLANGHNLKSSIKKTAKLMNIDEDILLLFLTSHGSKEHTISANFPPFKLNDINAETINTALNTAGIKWRIIIISACYSGGFIESLADPYALLITAASADRNSFGCGHDGKYTYFGEAYFENGLKQTGSFIKAFELAKEIIFEKENEEGFKNSNPQIRIGAKIEAKLKEYEKKLKIKGNNNWATTATN